MSVFCLNFQLCSAPPAPPILSRPVFFFLVGSISKEVALSSIDSMQRLARAPFEQEEEQAGPGPLPADFLQIGQTIPY